MMQDEKNDQAQSGEIDDKISRQERAALIQKSFQTEASKEYLSQFSVVLVEPLYGGNIGSVARAMKNMGIESLILVKPKQYRSQECEWMAKGSTDILDRAILCDSLQEAIGSFAVTVAVTRRLGKFCRPDFTPRQMVKVVSSLAMNNRIALIFGREDSGLSRQETAACQYVVNIPTSEEMPSLNLAQAVLLLCYELFQASIETPDFSVRRLAENENLELFYEHMEQTLTRLGFMVTQNPDHTMSLMRRIFSRSELDERDVRLLRGVFRGIENYMNVLEKRFRIEKGLDK